MVPTAIIIITYVAVCQSISAKKHVMRRVTHQIYQFSFGGEVAFGLGCRYMP